ncbi:MAG: AmmeMemoRadiSam system protein B [Candidatus Vogelbacteria bacterium RIFOXYD1_FULL_44_32]|uniref:AmmeMemoRadiSam system protein B n=1 Tax=Candidatus Vogelbacteria bacterium RIFOXYD1_FULL_44_32 TaxID=1802438 RepID=A0A1G2QDQ6_9BACT|nr:MAG: AmmeMemoRadiSam system protein B [Candidatus Vogelbacteria bacterium RIFOXYD1_FULL_44_32]
MKIFSTVLLKVVIVFIILVTAIVIVFFTRHYFKNNKFISSIVVPHHNLVADKRAEFFRELRDTIPAPATIILVSPNHYGAGKGDIQVSKEIWHVRDGELKPDEVVIDRLRSTALASEEPYSFTNEHGIYAILGDIKKNFPEARLVPLMLKEVSAVRLAELEKTLREVCTDCLLIASVDFSHYQPALLAELHDDLTRRALQKLDAVALLEKSEVDSGSALALMSLWAKSHSTRRFEEYAHTNSGVIYEDPDVETTTHIFGWYEKGEEVVPEPEVGFIFAGDAMFGRYVHRVYQSDFKKIFSQLGDRVFWGTDAAIINLEGAITTEPIVDSPEPNNIIFKFSPRIVEALTFLRVNGASLANNHSTNAGPEGTATTRKLLEEVGIKVFGGATDSGLHNVVIFQGEGLKLAVIGMNLTFPGQTPEGAVVIIKKLKEDANTKVAVFAHWGVEYVEQHNATQSAAAHTWIDAGADMVIGAHPHVIQDAEIYKGKPIFYSLGNFIFDQVYPETQVGLMLAGKFTESSIKLFALPIRLTNYQPQLIRGDEKKTVLDQLYFPLKDYVIKTPAGDGIEIEN